MHSFLSNEPFWQLSTNHGCALRQEYNKNPQKSILKMRIIFSAKNSFFFRLWILKICEYLVFGENKYILSLSKADYKVESWLSTYIRRSIAANSGIYIILNFFFEFRKYLQILNHQIFCI